jgi:hypothetical protein
MNELAVIEFKNQRVLMHLQKNNKPVCAYLTYYFLYDA